MKLGKALNQVETLKKEGLLNNVAFLHFNVRQIIDEKNLGKKLGNTPAKGLYMESTLLVFHDEYDLEHSSIKPPNTKEPQKFHLEPSDATNKEIRLIFNGVPYSGKITSGEVAKMKVTKFTFWIHQGLIGSRLMYKVDGLLEWDTIFCEADVPDFP